MSNEDSKEALLKTTSRFAPSPAVSRCGIVVETIGLASIVKQLQSNIQGISPKSYYNKGLHNMGV